MKLEGWTKVLIDAGCRCSWWRDTKGTVRCADGVCPVHTLHQELSGQMSFYPDLEDWAASL